MLWKVLSIFAAGALGFGAWLSYSNMSVHSEERKMGERSKKALTDTQDELKTITEKKTQLDEEVKQVEAQRDEIKLEVTKVEADTTAKVAEVELLKKSQEEVTKQLTQLDEQIRKYGDLQKMIAEVADLNKQKDAAAAEVSNKNQQLAFVDDKIKSVSSEITRMAEVQKRQRAGVVEPGFTARVAAPFNEFGYVILNKGNVGGMFANAMLEVKRGRNVVAKLKVRDVEQSMSVADIIPGTVASGASIRPGDLVVAAPAPPAPPAMPQAAPPADGGAAPAAAPGAPAMAPPGSDPFGAPPAGGMAPAAADPFAPAPAPAGGMAPSTADPFAPAPAAPAGGGMAPSTADPFAPAPPAGGGMAPAGGATDPFAPQPAPGN